MLSYQHRKWSEIKEENHEIKISLMILTITLMATTIINVVIWMRFILEELLSNSTYYHKISQDKSFCLNVSLDC